MIGPKFPDEVPTGVADRTLRQFAGLCVVFFGGLFAWGYYRQGGHPSTAAWVALGLALVVGLPGLAAPAWIRPVYLGIMAITQPIGHVMSYVLLGLIYYGTVTPIALAFRLAGRDPLARRRPALDSYWAPKYQPTEVTRYLSQYQQQLPAEPNPNPSSGARHGAVENA
jgi:hypothetical protein